MTTTTDTKIAFNDMTDLNFDLPSVNNNFFIGTGIPSVLGSSTLHNTSQFDYSWQRPTFTFAVLDSALDGVYVKTSSTIDYTSTLGINRFLISNEYSQSLNESRYLWIRVTQAKTIRLSKDADTTVSSFTINYKPICLGSIANILEQTGAALNSRFRLKVTMYLSSTSNEEDASDAVENATTDVLPAWSSSGSNEVYFPSITHPNFMITVSINAINIYHTVKYVVPGKNDAEENAYAVAKVFLWFVTSYDSSVILDPDAEIHGELSADNINIIRLKPGLLKLEAQPDGGSKPVWSANQLSEGRFLPITFTNSSTLWHWAKNTQTRLVDITCTLPSMLTWKEVMDKGYMPTYRTTVSGEPYRTQIALSKCKDSDDDYELLGAYFLEWVWEPSHNYGSTVYQYPTFMEQDAQGVWHLVSNWKDYGSYHVGSTFPCWVFAEACVKKPNVLPPKMTFSTIKTETIYYYRNNKTMSSSSPVKETVLDNSVTYITDKKGNQYVSKVSCGFYDCLVGDPRITIVRGQDSDIITTITDPKTGKETNYSRTTTTYSYRMSYDSNQKSYYNKSAWPGRTAEWVTTDEETGAGYVESKDLLQVLPDAYGMAKTLEDWPIDFNYYTVGRFKQMNTDDNPNVYKVISLGTTLVAVDSDCNYYGFIPPKTGLYKFTADSTNAFIGYANSMIDEEGVEMFGEATWADDGLSFTLMCTTNKMVFVACSTADFSYESYNLTIECLSE